MDAAECGAPRCGAVDPGVLGMTEEPRDGSRCNGTQDPSVGAGLGCGGGGGAVAPCAPGLCRLQPAPPAPL